MARKDDAFINKELCGMALMLVALFLFFSLVTGNSVFYPVGGIMQAFLLGSTGYFTFPIIILLFFFGLKMLTGKIKLSKRGALVAVMIFICLFCGFAIAHLIASPINPDETLGDYVARVFGAVKENGGLATSTIGGALFASLDHLLVSGVSLAGTYVIWAVIALLCGFAAVKFAFPAAKSDKTADKRQGEEKTDKNKPDNKDDRPYSEPDEEFSTVARSRSEAEKTPREEKRTYASANVVMPRKRKTLVVGDSDFEMREDEEEFDEIGGRDNGYDKGYDRGGNTANRTQGQTSLYSEEYNKDFESKLRYVKSGSGMTSETSDYGKRDNSSDRYDKRKDSYDASDGIDETGINGDIYMPNSFKAAVSRHAEKKAADYRSGDIETDMEEVNSKVSDEVLSDSDGIDFDEPFAEEPQTDYSGYEEYESVNKRKTDSLKPEKKEDDLSREKKSAKANAEEEEKEHNPFDEMPLNFKYNAPPLDLLKSYSSQENYADVEFFKRDKATRIINTLKVLGGVEASLANIVHGPTVTRFDIAIPDNVSIKTVLKYADDLKLRLQTKNDIRITPIPGTSLIGVEVANEQRSIVGLRDVIDSDVFKNTKKTALTFAIGKDIVGNPVVADLTKTLHMLIAGASGTGKSVGLNSLLISWFYKYSPADLRLIIVDPKLVEFKVFEGIPHLLFGDIITDAKTAVAMLGWAVKEMEARYTKMAELVVHNIDEYNDLIDPRKERKLPKIVIIIDEFADLMSTDKKVIEEKIGRLAQKARAAGMYLILATQRPSVNIIEGSIKTNFISRMAFKMSNATDSTTIIGEGGAEKLLGNGDLLYRMSYMANMERAQGAYIDMEEIKAVVNYIRDNNESYFNEAAMKEIDKDANPQIENVTGGEEKVPDYYVEALRIAVETGSISISMIQRRLKSCGFPKAAKIYDWMVSKGYVLDSQGGKQKQVTLSMEDFKELYGDYDV